MNLKFLALALAAAVTLATAPAPAQTLKSVKVEPAAPKPGETVTVTAQLELTDNPNCGLHIRFGDGRTTTAKVNQAKDTAVSATHAYAKPGTYKVVVEPKRVGVALKCAGENLKAEVVVAAPVAAAVPAKAAAPACPAGWALAPKSVNKKTGAFDCTAKAGTTAPAARLECPGSLSYFENTKKGRLGCRP